MKDLSINWGGNGPVIHLAHANSYHPAIYEHLISQLKVNYEVHSILTRPFDPEQKVEYFTSWDQFRDDFLEQAYRHSWENIIGVGHSLGSTITMMAAIKNPKLFSHLVIIEPPCIDQIFYTLLDMMPYSISKNLVPPSKIALKRRHKWPSKEIAFDLFRKKSIYKNIDDLTLRAFIDSGLIQDEEGDYRLAFSKFWESKIYCTIKNPYKFFPKLIMPCLCIRGGNTDVISERNWEKWQRVHDNASFLNIENGGHLVPLEKPIEIAKAIHAFLVETL